MKEKYISYFKKIHNYSLLFLQKEKKREKKMFLLFKDFYCIDLIHKNTADARYFNTCLLGNKKVNNQIL